MNDKQIRACPAPKGAIRNIKDGRLIPVCNKLSCPVCGKRRIGKLLDDIHYGADILRKDGETLKFLTLTTSPKTDQDAMGKYLHRFFMYLRKKGYKNIPYFWVLELTKTHLKHFHILLTTWIPQHVYKAAWMAANEGTAWDVNVVPVQDFRNVAGYMAKYLTKSLAQGENYFKKGEKRYGFSRAYPRLPKLPSTGEWEYVRLGDYLNELLDKGEYYEKPLTPYISPNTKLGKHATASEIIHISEVTYEWLRLTTKPDNALRPKDDKRKGAYSQVCISEDAYTKPAHN